MKRYDLDSDWCDGGYTGEEPTGEYVEYDEMILEFKRLLENVSDTKWIKQRLEQWIKES